MRTLRLTLFALAPFALSIAACGGSTASPVTGDAGSPSDTGTTHSGHDSGHPPSHDAATKDAPTATHDSGPRHDAVALDVGSPVDSSNPVDSSTPIDSSTPPDTGSSQDSGGNSPTCPDTVPTGNCSQPNLSCDYPPAGSSGSGSACICSNGDPPMAMTTWHCASLAAGCPTQPPTVGTVCTQAGLVCDYGMCMGGEEVECTNGKWKVDLMGGCPG